MLQPHFHIQEYGFQWKESILIEMASSQSVLDPYFEISWENGLDMNSQNKYGINLAFRPFYWAKIKRKSYVLWEMRTHRPEPGSVEALCTLGDRKDTWEMEQRLWSFCGVACSILQVVLIFPFILSPPPTCLTSGSNSTNYFTCMSSFNPLKSFWE